MKEIAMYPSQKAALALIVVISMAATLNAALLTGSVAPPPSSINLTAEGTSDWIHWGLNNASDVNRKASGGSQISTFTPIGSGDSIVRLTDSPRKPLRTDR